MNHGTVFFAPFKVATAIKRRARSAFARLRVARETLIGVEAGAEAIVRAAGHDLYISEPRQSILEERSFVGCKTLERSASTRWTTAHARVYWSWSGLAKSVDTCDQGQNQDAAKTLEHSSPLRHHGHPP
jgi:hypothetical protein